ARLAAEDVPGAFDVCRSEGLSVVPSYALPQREGQLGPFLIPSPTGGELWNNRSHAILLYVLFVDDEIIEDTHHRAIDRGGRFLVHRHTRRTVEMADFKNAARFLGESRVSGRKSKRQRPPPREHPQTSLHPLCPLFKEAGLVGPPLHLCWPVYWAL